MVKKGAKTKRVYLIYALILNIVVGVYLLYLNSESGVNNRLPYESKMRIENNNRSLYGNETYNSQEELCLNFTLSKLSSKTGSIYTNYLGNDKKLEYASGHEILSESEGLIMLYFYNKKEKQRFDQHFDFISKNMLLKNGTVKWRIEEDNTSLSFSSASIDDLRIARSIMFAYQEWGDEKYIDMLERLSNGLLDDTTFKQTMVSYYDEKSDAAGKSIELSYIDLYTMTILQTIDHRWDKVLNNSLKVISNGYISDEIPLYQKSFNLEKKEYSLEEGINMVDSLLVILHLSEVGLERKESIHWLKNKLSKDNVIYDRYSETNGEPLTKYQSTAVYAIIARIAKNIGDTSLYDAAISKMLAFQVTDPISEIYGAFGDINTLKVYSFDNLEALLAF